MLYGIIYDRGGGKYAFMMRQYTTFRSLEEENSLLPHIVAIIEEEMIGPSMGRDLLQKSIKALLAGILLVIVFMLISFDC